VKTLVKLLVILVLVVAMIVASVFMFTGGMVKDTKAFFVALKNDDTAKASGYLSKNFLESTSIEELKKYFDASNIADYKDSSWGSRSVVNNQAEISGSIKTESAKTVPLSIKFIKEGGKWKISAINLASTGLNSGNIIPNEEAQVQLVIDSMKAFADSVANKSMAVFRNHVSALWRNQQDLQKFEDNFDSIYGQNFSSVLNYSPVFSQESKIDEDGVMLIKGYYPMKNNKMNFEQEYIKEGLKWKLVAFSFNIE